MCRMNLLHVLPIMCHGCPRQLHTSHAPELFTVMGCTTAARQVHTYVYTYRHIHAHIYGAECDKECVLDHLLRASIKM